MGKFVHDFKLPVVLILFFFIILFFYSKYGPPLQFMVNSVQTTKQNLFLVQGKATKTAVPNSAFISVGVTKNATTIADAQNQTNTAITKIITSIESLGIDAKNIQTTNYTVSPTYDYSRGNSQIITGYTVTQNMQITIKPIDKLNQVTDVATSNGANLVSSVTFGFDETTQKQLQNEVRQMAIDDAKQKADALADAAGMRLGKIVDIQEDNQTPIQPIGLQTFKAANTAEAAPTNITPGENNITENVTLSYETY